MKKIFMFLLGVALIVGILVYVVADINHGDGLEAEGHAKIVRVVPSYSHLNLQVS